MTGPGPADVEPAASLLARLADRRRGAGDELFGRESDRIARCCHRMAERFARGGRLIAIGATPEARSDARHVAVEFVHPVIVGKRALPAIAITPEGGDVAVLAESLAEPEDIVIGFGAEYPGGEPTAEALAAAALIGCMTIEFPLAGSAAGADRAWPFAVPGADADVRQELIETLYHLLWELVHVFFDHRGLLEGREGGSTHDAGASSFLYPFLGERETDLDGVLADVRQSVLLKSEEIAALREATLVGNAGPIGAAAATLRERLSEGRLLALGNGGSATDAMDAVADFRAAGGRWAPRRAIDLTEDTAILTAIANDVGVAEIFKRQVIAQGRPGDVLVAFSTSGGSEDVIAALLEARERGIATIAMLGYDGGRVAAEGLADHIIVAPSENIPRIQEAQASAFHAIRELVG